MNHMFRRVISVINKIANNQLIYPPEHQPRVSNDNPNPPPIKQLQRSNTFPRGTAAQYLPAPRCSRNCASNQLSLEKKGLGGVVACPPSAGEGGSACDIGGGGGGSSSTSSSSTSTSPTASTPQRHISGNHIRLCRAALLACRNICVRRACIASRQSCLSLPSSEGMSCTIESHI